MATLDLPTPDPATPFDPVLDTTEEFWEVNNGDGSGWHTLNSFAWNITTLAGRYSIPPKRGENLAHARRPGSTYVAKVADSRTISLAMWVRGVNDDGSPPIVASEHAKFVANYRVLQNLFGVYDRQIRIRKRVPTSDGTLLVLDALAEVTSDMGLAPTSPHAGALVIDLFMADPFFYEWWQAVDSIGSAGSGTGTGYGTYNSGTYGAGVYDPTANANYTSGSNSVTIANTGQYECSPVVVLYGGFTSSTVSMRSSTGSGSLPTLKTFIVTPDAPVDQTHWVAIDTAKREIVYGTGSFWVFSPAIGGTTTTESAVLYSDGFYGDGFYDGSQTSSLTSGTLRYDWRTTGSQWLTTPPGIATITASFVNPVGSPYVAVYWRSAHF